LSKRCNATAKLKDGQGIVHARISEAKATQMCKREKKGGKREERRGRKDGERKNERNIHAGGSEGEGRSEGERARERESGSHATAAALQKRRSKRPRRKRYWQIGCCPIYTATNSYPPPSFAHAT